MEELNIDKIKFLAELSQNISCLQVHIWGLQQELDLKGIQGKINLSCLTASVQYKCVDGKLKININRKKSDQCQQKSNIKQIVISNKQISLQPKDTCIFLTKNILTIRFSLDKLYLDQKLLTYDNSMLTQNILDNTEKLSCRFCMYSFLGQSIKIRQSPSENWKEVIELWQCHDEDFSQFINPVTKELVVPINTALYSFNSIILHPNMKASLVQLDDDLKCQNCESIVGNIKEGKHSLQIESIDELYSSFNFKKSLVKQWTDHSIDNQTQDLLYTIQGKLCCIKIKVLNNQALISVNSQELFPKIKVLFNVIAQVQEQMLELLKHMNRHYYVTETQYKEIEQLLDDGQRDIDRNLLQFKSGLYQISYVNSKL